MTDDSLFDVDGDGGVFLAARLRDEGVVAVTEARMVRLDREQRREIAAEMHDAGMSNRAIAGGLGLGEATVRRDLTGASSDAPERPAPVVEPKVTGTDGKTYPAKTPSYDCSVCGAAFSSEVWHCERCGDHWPAGDECSHCAYVISQVGVRDPKTGAINTIPPVVPPPKKTVVPRPRKIRIDPHRVVDKTIEHYENTRMGSLADFVVWADFQTSDLDDWAGRLDEVGRELQGLRDTIAAERRRRQVSP